VDKNTVNAHGKYRNTELLEFGKFFGNCRNLRCSHKGEIARIKA